MVGKGPDGTLERVLLTCIAFPNWMPEMVLVTGFGIELIIGLGEVSIGVGRGPVGIRGWVQKVKIHNEFMKLTDT